MIVDTRECWQNLIMDESLGDLQRLHFHAWMTVSWPMLRPTVAVTRVKARFWAVSGG